MLDGVVWTERDISTRSPIWSVGTGRLMTGASVDCLPSAGRLLVFCDSCAVIVVDGPESGGMVRTGSGISTRFPIQSADSADSTDRRVDGLLRGVRRCPEFHCLRCHAGGPIRCARLSLGDNMGPKQESIPDTRSSPVIWRGRQSGNESGHQPANQPIICPKYQSSISPITTPSS